MHSIIVNRFPPPTSLYHYAKDLADANSGNSALLNILTVSPKWKNTHSGIDIHPLLGHNFFISGLLSRFTFVQARRFIIRNLSDNGTIIHMVAPFGSPAFAHGLPITATIHDSPKALFEQGLYRRMDEPASAYANRMRVSQIFYRMAMRLPFLSVNSKHVANSLLEYGYSGEIFVTYPVISSTFKPIENRLELRKRLGLPANRILILSVSIDEVRKNLGMVKKIMGQVSEWASIVRVGSDIGSGFHFSNLDPEMLNMVYNACDIMLLPSLEEGFGYPIAEALKVGLPVVASDIEVFREVAGQSAVFVNPHSSDDILRGLRDALGQKDTLVMNGMEMAKKFTLENLSKSLDAMYYKIMKEY